VVVHLAFLVTQYAPREEFWSVNVGGSENVFRAALAAGVRQIVYASSVAAYGSVPGHPVPIVETTPRVYQTAFPYAATKFEVEAALDALEPRHPDVAFCRLRPVILLGRHMEHALGASLRRRVIVRTGPSSLPLVWDEDVADAVVRAIHTRAHGAFNLAADEPLTAEEMAARTELRLVPLPAAARAGVAGMLRLLGRLGARVPDAAWLFVDAPMVLSSEKAKRELGWRPRCATCADVVNHFVDVVPGSLDPRILALLALSRLTARFIRLPPEAQSIQARIQIELEGARGGDLSFETESGRVRLRRGRLTRPTSLLRTRVETFIDLLRGGWRSPTSSAQGG
jgi:nucleoside-diphosphate-sugar epimerase